MSSDTPTADAQAGGGVQYTVVFVNNSTNSANACLYQTSPEGGPPGAMSLAWLSKYAAPKTHLIFQWSVDYSFVWAQTGPLQPGVVFEAAQMWPADLSGNNQITFTSQWGTYTFQNPTAGPAQGSLYIREDNTIAPEQAAVGIGMSGAATFAAQAQPNMSLVFTPHTQYWIAAGNYTQGEVLDVSGVNNPAQIIFPAGVYSMTATLNADNTWTIRPN
jgi:hypothetical protein